MANTYPLAMLALPLPSSSRPVPTCVRAWTWMCAALRLRACSVWFSMNYR